MQVWILVCSFSKTRMENKAYQAGFSLTMAPVLFQSQMASQFGDKRSCYFKTTLAGALKQERNCLIFHVK